MAEHGTCGRTPSQPAAFGAIERAASGVTAFVGRALRGPLNHPVPVGSFADFDRVFGGLWQPATLSYAVEQFFENGGRRAVIVRVANGARAPTLALPAGRGKLELSGIHPGSREYLRAAVDHDGIPEGEPDRFNLVVQRVRAPATEQIEEQEILRRVSIEPGSARFVGDLLRQSGLVRMLGDAPRVRPDPTAGATGGCGTFYVDCRLDGDDGAPLSDYDVIGSAAEATGLSALGPQIEFDLLCVPPLAREQDVGLATLHVAARLCSERRAMLVVDPPRTWTTAELAAGAMRSWPFRSENAVMFFPRIAAFDRLRGRAERFGSAAAAAGLLARQDEHAPLWAAAEAEAPVLRPALKPAVELTAAQRVRLSQLGINTLLCTRSADSARIVPSTLAGGAGGSAEWRHLSARRLALYIVSRIERGLRKLPAAADGLVLESQALPEVERFLEALHRKGAFAGSRPQDSYFVVCDERLNRGDPAAAGEFGLLFGIALARPAEFHAWLVTRRGGAGSRGRPVAVNRLATSPERVDWEIETSILRG